MAAISNASTDSLLVYNAAVGATKAEVTNNADALIYSVSLYNTTAAAAYLQVFDLDADAVTVGTTGPTYVLGVGANAAAHFLFPKPIRHTVGFTVAATTTRAGNTGATTEVTIAYHSVA